MKVAGLPDCTVGDFMHAWNADLAANPFIRRQAFDRVNAFGLDVKEPASRLPHLLGGGIVGRAAATYLGANPFWRNVATVAGAAVGNHIYNSKHPDPTCRPYAPGVVQRGF